jgi:hypothetical protein
VPRAFEDAPEVWAGRKERAQSALSFLDQVGLSADQWKQVADANAAVPTTLSGFDSQTCARLLHHAYVLTAVNAHVFLGHPLPDPARSREDFRALISS